MDGHMCTVIHVRGVLNQPGGTAESVADAYKSNTNVRF